VALSSTVGLAMKRPSDTQPSPLRRQAADALRRARKLPVGHASLGRRRHVLLISPTRDDL
jgi:hypothetical protein